MRAVFLDKDGTLVEDVPHNVDPARFMLAPQASETLDDLRRLGYALVVVSNQPGLAMGLFDDAGFDRMRIHLTSLLAADGVTLDGFYHCPHHPEGSVAGYAMRCECRKPQPGMLLRAANELKIDLAQSWMVGDILHDVEAGKRAGCKTILIDNGNETEWEWSLLRSPDIIVSDLAAAARAISLADRLATEPNPGEVACT